MAIAVDAPCDCILCEQAPRFRRGVCRVCHRKLSEAGIALPPRAPSGRAPWTADEWLRAFAAALPAPQRARLCAVLAAPSATVNPSLEHAA